MYDGRTLRILGLFLAGTGAAGLALCLVGIFRPDVALARGQWLAGAGASFVFLFVLWGDTRLAWRERQAEAARVETINEERWLRNREREARLEGTTAPTTPARDYAPEWRVMFHRFVVWGASYGFNVRDLGVEGEPGHCVGWDDWTLLKDFGIEAGVLTGAGRNTRFADDWDLARWERERLRTPLPYRSEHPPTVAIPVQHATPNTAAEVV